MSLLDEFARVSRSRPCPICQHVDWCLVSRDNEADPSKVICARVESKRRFGQAGWLHVLRDDGKRWDGVRRRKVRLASPKVDESLAALAEQFRGNLTQELLAGLASSLKLSFESLRRFHVGWNGSAFSFPMFDPEGRVVGIALRRPDGSKYAVKGGHHGLFIPAGIVSGDRLLVCEGQTDTAACIDLGFQAVGRPGCRSTLQQCVELAKRLAAPSVVVVGDADEEGHQGAAALASALAVRCRDVRVVFPPEGVKDAREWKRRGATRADVETAIEASAVVKLKIGAVRKRVRT